MARLKKSPPQLIFDNPQNYINREQSWLEFNNRVLHEALDLRTPLLERLKFLAIFSSNLDEYFMVRVSALKEQVEAKVSKLSPDGLTPQEQLDLICQRLRPTVAQQHQYFEQKLRPLLAAQGICLLDYIDLNQEQRTYFQRYFEEQIFPVLTPLAVDPSHPFPFISNLSLNLAVLIKDSQTAEEFFARVKVPSSLPRFLQLPEELQPQPVDPPVVWTGVPLEQVIAHNLGALFPGMDIQEYHPFRVTRDADVEVQEDEADDLLQAIEEVLRQRRFGGSVVRTPPAALICRPKKGISIAMQSG
jgi:polyphosphate kinase